MIRRRLARFALVTGLVTLTVAAAPAARAVEWETLPAPTNLHAMHVSDTAADLDWLSSALSDGDVLERQVNGQWQEYARGLYGFIALSGLTPGTTYTFRAYTLGNDGLWTKTSPPSQPLTFTTLSGPDAVPPATPTAPTFSSVSTSAATVFWPETTDNVQVTGYYLDQLVGGAWTTLRTVGAFERFQSVRGLSPATAYTFGVRAFDARGNVSARSDPGTVTTRATTTAPTCDVQLVTFRGGFQASISVSNSTTTTINGWTLRFTVPAAVTVGWSFGGVLTRSGDQGTLTPAPWNAVLGPGGGVNAGFSGSSSTNAVPSNFTFNGTPCTQR